MSTVYNDLENAAYYLRNFLAKCYAPGGLRFELTAPPEAYHTIASVLKADPQCVTTCEAERRLFDGSGIEFGGAIRISRARVGGGGMTELDFRIDVAELAIAALARWRPYVKPGKQSISGVWLDRDRDQVLRNAERLNEYRVKREAFERFAGGRKLER